MHKSFKIILAVLLFLCLADMPYGYYQFIRIFASILFVVSALEAKSEGADVTMWIYVGLAILFQPIFKISLGRELWNLVDVIVGVGLLISAFSDGKK